MMGSTRPAQQVPYESFRVTNAGGSSPVVFVCDHATNAIPPEFGTLGLTAGDLVRHIAWDPGALPVARLMASALDATLVESTVSRLVIDCNRPLDAPDLIASTSETTPIPGNATLTEGDRARRVALAYEPFHAAIESVVEDRLSAGRETWLVSVHSFTPVYRGVARPWEIGILHDEDTRLAAPLIAALRAEGGLSVGVNQPYSPADRVYHTLEVHGRRRGLACAMIEVRNDEISEEAGQQRWGERLSRIFARLREQEEVRHAVG